MYHSSAWKSTCRDQKCTEVILILLISTHRLIHFLKPNNTVTVMSKSQNVLHSRPVDKKMFINHRVSYFSKVNAIVLTNKSVGCSVTQCELSFLWFFSVLPWALFQHHIWNQQQWEQHINTTAVNQCVRAQQRTTRTDTYWKGKHGELS